MNNSHVAKYAPQARKDFVATVTNLAGKCGLSAKEILPVEIKGDVALVGDRLYPSSIVKSHDALVEKVNQIGFHQAMEQAACSWFSLQCVLRCMELADYLRDGRRVQVQPGAQAQRIKIRVAGATP